MPSYSNGYIPDSLLVTFNTGWNSTDGNWKHQLSAGTYRKHLNLVALAKRRTGRTLEITEGWGAYRPRHIQELARKIYGNGAAWPGTSSHGGFWEGKQTLAIDYGNWGWVYDWNREAFYADARAAGLAPGLIHPSRGNDYPDEPWHVVDLEPWAAVSGGNGDDDMSVEDIYNARDNDGRNTLDLGRQTRADIEALRGRIDDLIAQLPTRVWQFPIQAQDIAGRPLSADGKPVNYAAHGYLASTVAQLGAKLGTAEVDEQALAVALAPLLAENMSALPDADVDRIAKRSADVLAERLSARPKG